MNLVYSILVKIGEYSICVYAVCLCKIITMVTVCFEN